MIADQMVIRATFADWHPVKGRKQLQLIFEVPLEDTNIVLRMLGPPMPDKQTWCAIALLGEPNQPVINNAGSKYQRAFCDLPFVQQAALKSKDAKFQRALVGYESEADCAAEIRKRCGVASRAEILPGTEAGRQWLAILNEYEGVR